MFNKDFFPTPENVILQMMEGYDIQNKIIMEPSAGKGNIVDYIVNNGALNVIACENNQDLKKILITKCKVIADDFLTVSSEQISHVDFIVMNPPFSADEKHINHAWDIAPKGCHIIALCNLQTIENPYNKGRERLNTIISENGSYEDLGDCFSESERKTGVNVGLIRIQKPGSNNSEFEGFFIDEDEPERQENGIMSYNVVRDLVNRYVQALKIFDEQLEAGVKMHNVTQGFFSSEISFSCSVENKQTTRNDFKKDLQKSGWKFIFNKMNMDKYTTRGLKEDINKFVEKQTQIPFTMRNIYKMLEMVVGTNESRMNKAIIEVFDQVTGYHADNKYHIEGWKTNKHYLLTKRFIMPWLTQKGWSGQIEPNFSSNFGMVEDLVKALCYITGDNYSHKISLEDALRYSYFLVKDGKFLNDPYYTDHDVSIKKHTLEEIQEKQKKIPGAKIHHIEKHWGKWFDWGYFKIRAYKKGTIHFEFKDEKIWGAFNQRVAKIKGYPLYEHVKKTEPKQSKKHTNVKPTVLFEIVLK